LFWLKLKSPIIRGFFCVKKGLFFSGFYVRMNLGWVGVHPKESDPYQIGADKSDILSPTTCYGWMVVE
jgi:hypothetical protein